MNPVWKRELRARWRSWRGFVLVFLYALVLSSVFAWAYDQSFVTGYQDFADPRQRMSLMGHNLFVLLAWLQLVLWMVLAPILTATAITAERERGLLEGLHLSRLRTREIVLGKLLSALSLAALLLLVTLPITATCFLMGGVSPGEFVTVLGIHASTAVCCAAIGLATSAWCKNSLSAIVLGVLAVGAWSGLAAASVAAAFGAFSRVFPPVPPAWPWNQIWELFARAHPVAAMFETTNNDALPGGIPWTTSTPSWIVSLVFLSGFTLFFLWIATLGSRRAIASGMRIEWQQFQKELSVPDASDLQRDEKEGAASRPQRKPIRRMELGWLSRVRFSNPILGREIRASFRPRSTSIAMLVVAGLLVPVAAFAYFKGMYWALFDSNMREVMAPALLVIYLLVAIVLSAILGAGGLSREREGGTWEALRLSLLTPREILQGKIGVPLWMCAICGLIFLPMLLLSTRTLVYSGSTNDGLSLTQLVASLAVLLVTAWSCTLLGLTFSQYAKRSVSAICWTLGVLFVGLLVAPMFLSETGSYESQRAVERQMTSWHPVMAMTKILSRPASYTDGKIGLSSVTADALPCLLLWLALGIVLHLFLLRALGKTRHPSPA